MILATITYQNKIKYNKYCRGILHMPSIKEGQPAPRYEKIRVEKILFSL